MAAVELSVRERLLDAADVLMYQHGYEAVGVADLCRVANARKGSFYHFFDSKQALALEMLDRAWQRTRSELFAPTFGNEELGVLAAIDLYVKRLVRHLERFRLATDTVAGCRFGNFAAELAALDDAIRQRIADIFVDMQAIVASSVDRSIARGELAPSLDAAGFASDFIALMEGRMMLAKASRNPKDLSSLGATARRLLR